MYSFILPYAYVCLTPSSSSLSFLITVILLHVLLIFTHTHTHSHTQSVQSGDTLLLVGKATNGPPPEITITLPYVQCPKIARGPSQVDEPFAWEAREFLRALCVGKQVTFKVTQTVMSINRTFGDVFLDGVPIVKVGSFIA